MAIDLTKVTKQQFMEALGLSGHAAAQLAGGKKKLAPDSLKVLEAYLGGGIPPSSLPKEKDERTAQSPVRASSTDQGSDLKGESNG